MIGALAPTSLAALICLVVLVGCSGENTGEAQPTDGPLTAIMDATIGLLDQDYYDTKQIESENLVAACMAAEGFEYVPHDSTGTAVRVDMDDFAGQDTKEWVTKNGYGMAMIMDKPLKEWVDPNADYVASLSEAELAAYYEALIGTDNFSMTADEQAAYEADWEGAGCRGVADHEAYRDQEPLQDPQFEDVVEAMYEIPSVVRKDPRIVDLSARWADCMADAGYTGFSTPDDAVASVGKAQNELYKDGINVSQGIGPSDEDLAAFRDLEISTALTDFACKEKVDLMRVTAEVTLELEEVFVKDNKAALDEFVAAVENARQPKENHRP